MFTDIEVIAIMIFSFALGIALTIMASFIRERINEKVNVPLESKLNYDNRIAPFVEIHQSLVDGANDSAKSKSVNRLKEKIEGFKHRNRFYKG